MFFYMRRYYRAAPLKMSSVSSSGLASSLERLSCYERALPNGLSQLKVGTWLYNSLINNCSKVNTLF